MKDMGLLKNWYKVPFRMVYCSTFKSWLTQTVYCHIVLKLDPPPHTEIV